MKRNSKINVAVHALLHIVKSQKALTSEELAQCLESNPVVVRRILGQLRNHDIVTSEKGHGGGWSLGDKQNKLTLLDVYKALDERLLPEGNSEDQEEHCIIMKTLMSTMSDFYEDAQLLLDARLKRITIKSLIEDMHH